jgi:hypothetical protein
MDRIAVNSGREQISALSRSRAGRLGNCPDGDGSRHPTRCREGLLAKAPPKPPAEAGGVTLAITSGAVASSKAERV